MSVFDFITVTTVILLWVVVFCVVLGGAWILSTLITTYLALTGLGWWCVTILIFLFILALFSKVTSTNGG